MMHPVAALFGLACAGAVVLSRRTGEIAAVVLAWALVGVWAAANLLWLADATRLLPLVDLPVAMAAFGFWLARRSRWLSAFAGIYAARLVLHLTYPGTGAAGEVAYLHLTNATFLAALVALSWKGGADAIGDCLRGFVGFAYYWPEIRLWWGRR